MRDRAWPAILCISVYGSTIVARASMQVTDLEMLDRRGDVRLRPGREGLELHVPDAPPSHAVQPRLHRRLQLRPACIGGELSICSASSSSVLSVTADRCLDKSLPQPASQPFGIELRSCFVSTERLRGKHDANTNPSRMLDLDPGPSPDPPVHPNLGSAG